MSRKKKQNNQKKQLYTIILVAFVVCIYGGSIVSNFKGCSSDKQEIGWNKANVDDSYVTGNTTENTQSVTLGKPAETEAEVLNRTEAPSEGLSQQVYENLEQPGVLPATCSETLLFKHGIIISYNTSTYCPNYVAWHLTKERINGSVSRTDKFHEDYALNPRSQITTNDYSGSGYDRGHMCPAGDCKSSEDSMFDSFSMTNICPQTHNLNAGDWKELEEQCRQWVKGYDDLFIVAGPIFDTIKPKTIGKRKDMKISVPDRFFKVVLMMGREPKALGFIYPNSTTNQDMRTYCVSVDEVEKITGFDFYPNLPDNIERKVERECKPAAWGI